MAAAVADPVRRRILELLLDGETPAGTIAEAFPVSRPAVSRHLRVLREAGLVQARVVGQQRVYRLERAPLVELDGWLDRFRPWPAQAAVGRPAGADAPGLAGDGSGRRPPGPAGRLDALGTEVRRGRRARASEGRRDDRDSAAG